MTKLSYEEIEGDDYRKRFPNETKGLSNDKLAELVSATEDDMSDADWKSYFKTGILPETDSEYDLDAIRENFEEAKGRKVKVSDKVLGFAIQNNPQWDEWMSEENSEAIFAFIEKVEDAATRVAITDPGISALADKIDDVMYFEIGQCVDAVMKNKTTAVDIYAQLHRVYTLDELNAFPFAGSDEKSVLGTNYKADKVKTTDKVTGVEMTTVWLNDYCSAMRNVKAWEDELVLVGKELKTSGSVPKYKNTSRAELLSMQSELTGKRNGVRSMFKRAINLHHQFNAVNGMPLVSIEWIPGDKKSGIVIPSQYGEGKLDGVETFLVSKSPKPLFIYPKGQASKGKVFSVTQITNFDVSAALKGENGGTMGDLIATLSKGGDEPSKDGDGSKMDIEEAIGTAQRFSNFLDVKDNIANYRRVLADKKRDDRQDLLETLEAIYHSIAPLHRLYEDELKALKEKAAQKVERKAS